MLHGALIDCEYIHFYHFQGNIMNHLILFSVAGMINNTFMGTHDVYSGLA